MAPDPELVKTDPDAPPLAGRIGDMPRTLARSLTHEPLAGFGRSVLDFLFPPTCAVCGAPTASAEGVCASCWRQLRPITAPLCPVLGLPFAADPGSGAVSPQALQDPPPFDRARAAFVYDGVARALITRLKFADHPELARLCARTMAAAGDALLAGDPVLVPVPLHFTRHLHRRFNQSAELAREIARLTGRTHAPGLIRRRRRTRQQIGLNAAQRARNVAGAFTVDTRTAASLLGRRLLIIDDVLTTGATVSAMTRALNRAGFGQIDVLSFARVVSNDEIPV